MLQLILLNVITFSKFPVHYLGQKNTILFFWVEFSSWVVSIAGTKSYPSITKLFEALNILSYFIFQSLILLFLFPKISFFSLSSNYLFNKISKMSFWGRLLWCLEVEAVVTHLCFFTTLIAYIPESLQVVLNIPMPMQCMAIQHHSIFIYLFFKSQHLHSLFKSFPYLSPHI